ncbi:MAG: Rieske 2Fe-2S domain-containing protein [Gammaproteobacteria bacterium]|nr:Rieske 2Fe-2S domain-containing protein [Gammaproteobacteria bacterium]
MPTTTPLCKDGELQENQCREVELLIGPDSLPAFLVCRHGRIHCYINSCPHTGATLNWNPDRFLDISQTLIQCSLHGALFRIESGECIFGPCAGQHLRKIPAVLRDSVWFAVLENPDDSPGL